MPPTVRTVDLSTTTTAYHAAGTIVPAGKQLHVSGQVGTLRDGTVPADYESQLHLALLNLRKIILAAGASIRDIVKLNLLIVNYGPANRKHTRHVQRFLAGHRPAITLIPVQQLAVASWLVEIDAVVAVPEQSLPATLPHPHATQSVDVVIIGAGLAGLTAAHEILRAGLSCVVLEARDRVGGKTWSMQLENGQGTIDLGAAWINDTNQSRVYGLARRFGAELIEQNTQGNAVLQDFDGKGSPFAYGELPNFDATTKAHLAEIRDMCEADCQALDTWKPRDSTLDSLTFEAYLRSRGANPAALATAAVWTRAMLGQDPRDISALFFLNYCKSGGGLLQMRSDRKGGGQHLRIRQGTQMFALGLASSLPEGSIQLSTPVHQVVRSGREANIIHTGGAGAGPTYAARKVISTIPTPALRNITFHPTLPLSKRAWIESSTYGYYTKAMLEFTAPFWVARGYCGLAQSFTGPASVIRDTSSPQDGKHILTCFMTGDPGLAWAGLSKGGREDTLLEQVEKLFGLTSEPSVDIRELFVQLSTYEWSKDEWAGWGCPSPALTPGVLDAVGGDALREPWGDVHFAGTETAGEWKGYMEGAVRSGERAAGEVVQALGRGVVANL
ncbi:putative flavin-containing amine oxidase [Aspergillus carlsbadensis]|nr:putative flavin-containing amine oxidase [Aspergillus carlsbadensis]